MQQVPRAGIKEHERNDTRITVKPACLGEQGFAILVDLLYL